MKKIFTAIDLGSYSIKIVVSELVNHKFHVLADSCVRCKGIQNGIITDIQLVQPYLLKAKQDVEDMLGIPIHKAIVNVSQNNMLFDIVEGKVGIKGEDGIVSAEDVNHVLQEATIGKIKENYKLITISPISFQVDGKEPVRDPKDLTGQELTVKAVTTSIPKDSLKSTMELMKACDIEIADISFGSIGDYYEARNKEFESCVTAIINIGYHKTEISIFNKGIMIKSETIPEGSRIIDRELAYTYHIKKGTARKLKENFAISNTRYSDVNEKITLTTKEGEPITMNQLEVSEKVEARIIELLRLAEKQIKLLTNREISYIMITGGISELAGFEYVVENVFDRRCRVLNMNSMGIRNNMYSSCFGMIKYFYHKLDLRGTTDSMIEENVANNLVMPKEKVTSGVHNNMISKVFGFFSGE